MEGESTVLEEAIDDDYEPSEEEIHEYATWLGMDLEADRHLLWIAKEGLKAPLPKDWKPCQSPDGEIYYFNFSNGDSVWDHPCDEHYRALYQEEKAKLPDPPPPPTEEREAERPQGQRVLSAAALQEAHHRMYGRAGRFRLARQRLLDAVEQVKQQHRPQPDREPEQEPFSTCLLCGVKVGMEHLAQHFAECFDEHCPVDVAPGDEDGLVKSHSVALGALAEELDALRVALFDESALGEPFPASVVRIILEKLDMSTLGRLGCVSRGWQKLCRVSCRVHCAHEVKQLAQLLPDRHMQLALDFLGQTAAQQNRRVCQLEQRTWQFTGDTATITVKTLTGRRVYHVYSTPTGGSTTRFGVLGAIYAGDLSRLIHNDDGCPIEQILLMDSGTHRPLVHWDVPLIFYTTPDAEGQVFVDMNLRSNIHPLDRESVTSFEALVRERGEREGWRARGIP